MVLLIWCLFPDEFFKACGGLSIRCVLREREGRNVPSALRSHRLDEPHRDIPWLVALQQSRPPFLPAPLSITEPGFGEQVFLRMIAFLEFAVNLEVLFDKRGAALEDVGGLLHSHSQF